MGINIKINIETGTDDLDYNLRHFAIERTYECAPQTLFAVKMEFFEDPPSSGYRSPDVEVVMAPLQALLIARELIALLGPYMNCTPETQQQFFDKYLDPFKKGGEKDGI